MRMKRSQMSFRKFSDKQQTSPHCTSNATEFKQISASLHLHFLFLIAEQTFNLQSDKINWSDAEAENLEGIQFALIKFNVHMQFIASDSRVKFHFPALSTTINHISLQYQGQPKDKRKHLPCDLNWIDKATRERRKLLFRAVFLFQRQIFARKHFRETMNSVTWIARRKEPKKADVKWRPISLLLLHR